MPEDPIRQTRSENIDLLSLRWRFIPPKQAAVDQDTGASTQTQLTAGAGYTVQGAVMDDFRKRHRINPRESEIVRWRVS